MTDLVTTPGADEVRPEDDAPIDDPAMSDADIANDVDPAHDEALSTDDTEASEALTDDGATDAADEAEIQPDGEASPEDEAEVFVEDEAADGEDEPADELDDEDEPNDVSVEDNADSEDEPDHEDSAEEEPEGEVDGEDEGVTADDAVGEDDVSTEEEPEENAAEEDEAAAAAEVDENVDEASPTDDDSPETDADAETAPEQDAELEDEANELADEDAASLDESALLDSPTELVDRDAATQEHELADQATLVGAVVAASATGATATATAVLAAPAGTLTAPQAGPVEPSLPTGPDSAIYAWTPVEPQPRKSRKALWIGVGAGAAAIGLVVASLVLIAPGTAIAGVPVGFLTSTAATEAVQHRLATTTIVLTGAGGDAEITGADLGASVDARGLAEAAYAENPLWNVTAWFPDPVAAPVRIDEQVANSALRAVAPELYVDPVDATLAFDASSVSYVTTPAVAGEGIDVEVVRTALQEAFESGQSRVELEATVAPVVAATPTYVAEATAAQLNDILDHAGFYVGTERTVPVDRAVAATWLTVTPGERGTFEITADESAIEDIVATLPEAVDRETVHATVITDSNGEVLQEVAEGVTGRTLGDTGDVASEYAAQLASGDPHFELPVDETPFTTTTLERRIEVDLGSQVTYLYENDKVVASYAISSGLAGTPTFTGSYRVFAHTSMQDMGCFEDAPYCTENVPWITWFNGDQAFHGTYWHNNFGNRMSHGCVNMPIDIAKFVYDWAPVGTEVWVHA